MAESENPASGPNTDRYMVVARRYRPKAFDQLVGQDHVARALANAIETGRIGHAYLFTGARGVGKTSTARIFAKALNADGGPSVCPDPESDISLAIDSGEDIDVLEIDGASNRGIDEIRQLRAGAGIRPSRARYKIYIIDEVHMLTKEAFNALLKTLEEPPEHVKFIFCTTAPEKIPITVLSRCQRFDFAPVRMEAIAGRLREIVDAEGSEADEDALRLLARRANGSMRDSQSLLEQVLAFSRGRLTAETVHEMLGTADDTKLAGLSDAILAHDARSAMEQVEHALAGGVEAGQLAEQLLGYFRDMMAATVGCDAEMLRFCSPGNHARLAQQGQAIGLQTLLAVVALLDQALVRIRHSVYGQILLEAALVQICSLPDLDGVSRLASALIHGRGDEKKNVKPLSPGVSSSRRAEAPAGLSAGNFAKPPAVSAPTNASPSDSNVGSGSGAPSAPMVQGKSAGPGNSTGFGTQLAGTLRTEARPETQRSSVPGAADSGAADSGMGRLANDRDRTNEHGSSVRQAQKPGEVAAVAQGAAPSQGVTQAGEMPSTTSVRRTLDGVQSGKPIQPEVRGDVAKPGRTPGGLAQKGNAPSGGDAPGPRPSLQVLKRQRLREFEQNEKVRRVIEMFEAEIIRIDDPHLGL